MREGQSNSATLGLPQVDKAVYSVAIIFTMSSFPFSRPSSPAAKCLHLIRLRELTSRSELVKDTHLSQPTITRAVAALVKAGYVTERTDLTRAASAGLARFTREHPRRRHRRGREVVPSAAKALG